VRLPDKSSGVLCSGASVKDKYEFIDAEYAAAAADTATTAPTVSQMCEWLRVSKSGYYEWRSNPGSATSKRREEIKLYIVKAFEDSDGTYGYRRVHAQLLRWGV
jgi:putative transposase